MTEVEKLRVEVNVLKAQMAMLLREREERVPRVLRWRPAAVMVADIENAIEPEGRY